MRGHNLDQEDNSLFLKWAKNDARSKRESSLISYLVGDAANIENIADRLAITLEAYNENFKKITRHNVLVDKNLNNLAKLGEI